jgi:hypothetical protein
MGAADPAPMQEVARTRRRFKCHGFAIFLALFLRLSDARSIKILGTGGAEPGDGTVKRPVRIGRRRVILAEPQRIRPEEVKRRMDNGEPVLLIDTRSEHAWNESNMKLPGALRIHYKDLEEHLDKLPRDRLIVTYCT